jgi:hypothetical protein
VDDKFGMMIVVALLDYSLNTGVNEATVQFNTIQKQDLQFQIMREPLARKICRPHRWDIGRGRELVSLTLPCTHCGLIDL